MLMRQCTEDWFIAEERANITAKKRKRTVQRKLIFHSKMVPGEVGSPAAEPSSPQSIPEAPFGGKAGVGIDDSAQLDTLPPSDGTGAALSLGVSITEPVMQMVVALGISLTGYTRLHRLRELQTELCGGGLTDCDATDTAHPQEKELRLRCIELLLRMNEEVGCLGLAPLVVPPPRPGVDCVSEVYMNLLCAVSASQRNALACAVLLNDIRTRLGV